MRRVLPAALLAAALLIHAGPARAQGLGPLAGARPIPAYEHLFGAYVQASNDAVNLLAQLRLSFYPGIDFGFQGGGTRLDLEPADRTGVLVGGDVRFQLARVGQLPFDASAGAALEITTADDISLVQGGPFLAVSRTFEASQSFAITPYVSFGFQAAGGEAFDESQSDGSFPIHLGGEFRVAGAVSILLDVEFPWGNDTGISDDTLTTLGLNFPF